MPVKLAKTQNAKLPDTGDTSQSAALLGGIALSGAFLVGKKKKKTDDETK